MLLIGGSNPSRRFACRKGDGHGKIGLAEGCCGLGLLARRGRGCQFGHAVKHPSREGRYQRVELFLFGVAQDVVEIEVEKLQIEVGGYETGEVGVVVLLVNVEQLLQPLWYDGEALTTHGSVQSGVEGF